MNYFEVFLKFIGLDPNLDPNLSDFWDNFRQLSRIYYKVLSTFRSIKVEKDFWTLLDRTCVPTHPVKAKGKIGSSKNKSSEWSYSTSFIEIDIWLITDVNSSLLLLKCWKHFENLNWGWKGFNFVFTGKPFFIHLGGHRKSINNALSFCFQSNEFWSLIKFKCLNDSTSLIKNNFALLFFSF